MLESDNEISGREGSCKAVCPLNEHCFPIQEGSTSVSTLRLTNSPRTHLLNGLA